MPKEVTHWVIAEETAKRLGQPAFNAVKENRNALLMGAVLHDALYFYRGKNEEIITLPDSLHGAHNEDTFDVLRRLLTRYFKAKGNERDCLLAFTVGVASHIFTDNNFHPMVYHMTGNYYDEDPKKKTKAVARHRTLEGVMDLYFRPDYKKHYDLKHILKHCECGFDTLFADLYAVKDADGKERDIHEDITGSYEFFAWFRGIYAVPFYGNILNAVKFLLPASVKEIAALFYPNRLKKSIPALSGPVTFHNPVTNDKTETTLQELKEKAVQDTVNFCKLLEKEYLSKNNPDIKEIGASLETGLVNSNVKDMKHYNIFHFA